MTMKSAIAICILLCACGSKKPKTNDEGGPGIDTTSHGDTTDHSANMIPPEKEEEVTRLLDRKRPTVSRCLTMVVDNQQLPKGSKGKMTLGITISPAGKATGVKVISSSLESKPLEECVIGKIQEIQFPDLPKSFETTYAYAFEAIQ